MNFRLHPRDTPERVIEYVKLAIADDRVSVTMLSGWNASRVAANGSPAFRAMAYAVRRVYGDVVVAPGLTIAATDSKHYEAVSDNAYRFNPMMISSQDLTGFHGTNERLSIENLVRATHFYIELIKSEVR